MRILSILCGVLGAVCLAGMLSACGSSGSASASASGSGGSGAGSGSASASGTVTGFGSIYVNGKKFEAHNVLVKVDDGSDTSCTIGPPSAPSDDSCGVKKGMVVTVNGSFNGNQHTAISVRQKDAVEGLVQSVAADQSRLVVMGQTVLVDSTTIIDNNITGRDLATLNSEIDHVEVNGHIQPDGIIQATFIELKTPPAVMTPEVRGYVSDHVAGNSSFQIGDLIVRYIGADIGDMPPPNGNNWDGLFVEVKGLNAAAFDIATVTLTASKVELEDRGVGDDVDEFEVEGFVRQASVANGIATFFIGTTEVRTTSSTEFREGTIVDLVDGAKVSVEGRLSGGILTAQHVKFQESVRLEGEIESVAGTSPAFTLTIKGLAPVTVHTDSLTRLEITPVPGAHVRVRGRVIGNNTVIATRLQEQSGNDAELRGAVQNKAGAVITILGVSIDTSTINHFESVGGTSIDRSAFLAAVEVNSLVKVKGEWNGTSVTWNEAELEE